MPVRPLVLLLPTLLLAACGGSNKAGTLSVSARGQGTPSAASVDLGNGISVSRVRVLVRHLELRGTVASMGTPMPTPAPVPTMASAPRSTRDEGGGDDGGEGEGGVEIGPFVVDVGGASLSGSVTEAFDASVPDGTYDKVEIAIGPVTGAAAGTALADMGDASVIVDGTRAASGSTPAADFHVSSSLRAQQELKTNLVVNHAASSANVTLLLDLKTWFTAADGHTLDPTVAADLAAIQANIAASLHFERDDNHDGEDDDGGPGHD